MCGIAGYYSTGDLFNPEHLRQMNQTLSHRGPDSEGFFHEGPCGFAHRRLCIMDLSERASQPMTSADGRFVIIYNGEIYNFQEIGAQLKSRNVNDPVQFRTSSDTEVILESFARDGVDFVHQLNGMFAFAIYDRKTTELYLFRDRLGIKPLFYYWDGKNFAFASELKALASLSVIKKEIKRETIRDFLNLGFIPAPSTIYKNIYKVESGSWLKILDTELQTHKYWSISNKLTNNVIYDKDQAIVKLSDLIISSVQYQLKSDVPFGVFLSGGIDSSLVTAQAVTLSSVKVKTFSIGFEENSHNESEYAKAVANYLGTEHYEFIVSHNDAINLIEKSMDIYDEPFADSSSIPTMLVSKLAKQYVTVTLSGEGGDELFYGYGSHIWAKKLDAFHYRYGRKLIAGILGKMKSRYARVGKLLDFDNETDKRLHIYSQEQYFFSEKEINELLVDQSPGQISIYNHPDFDLLLRMSGDLSTGTLPMIRVRKLSSIEQQALFDLKYYLQDDLLTKVDRASMQFSLETRVPYLDHRLVEYAINLSPDLKYRNNITKFLLKEILYQYIPKTLFNRPKQGFAIPLNKWLNKKLSYLIDDYLSREVVTRFNVVNYNYVKELIESFRAGMDYKYNRIWLLIVLHRWLLNNSAE